MEIEKKTAYIYSAFICTKRRLLVTINYIAMCRLSLLDTAKGIIHPVGLFITCSRDDIFFPADNLQLHIKYR